MNKRKMQLYPWYFTIPAIVIFGVFFAVPVVLSFMYSFTDWNLMRFNKPVFNGIENFVYLFKDELFLFSMKNTFIFAALTVVLKTIIGFFLALLLMQKFFMRNIVRTMFILPSVLSMVIIGILFIALFRMDGLINQFLSTIGLGAFELDWLGNRNTSLYVAILADVWRWSGFGMAIFIAGMQSIPTDYYEAAAIDGASRFQSMCKITLPLLAPSFNVMITFNLIGGLKVFEQVFVVTNGGPGYSSQVLGTYLFKTFGQGLLGRSTAMGVVLFILVLIFSQVAQYLLKKAEVDY